jgi:hypothetical protein
MAEHSINKENRSISKSQFWTEHQDIWTASSKKPSKYDINRDNGFTLCRAWNPVTKLLFKHDLDIGKAAIGPAH